MLTDTFRTFFKTWQKIKVFRMEISTLNFSKLQERLRKLVTCNDSFMWRLWKQKCKVARECARVTRTREKPYSFCYTIQQHQVKDIGEQALLDFSIGISSLQKSGFSDFLLKSWAFFILLRQIFSLSVLCYPYIKGLSSCSTQIISCRNRFFASLTHNLLDKNTSFRILQQPNR